MKAVGKTILGCNEALRVQVPKSHLLAQNLYHDSYYPKPKYLIIWYVDPLGGTGSGRRARVEQACVLDWGWKCKAQE